MKKKTKRKPLIAEISLARIHDLSNDLSENVHSGMTAEWRAVALYFRNEHDRLHKSMNSLRVSLAGFALAHEMHSHMHAEITRWLKENKPS